MFIFDLSLIKDITRPTGGVWYYFQLAHLLNKNGIKATVRMSFFPDFIEEKYKYLLSDNAEGILICPEVYFGHYLAHEIDAIPLVWEPWLLADGIEYEPNHPCLVTTPFAKGAMYEAQMNPLYIPLFVEVDEYIELPEKRDISLATVKIQDRKRPYDVMVGNIQVFDGMSHKEIIEHLKRTKTFIYPSRKEGFGLPILEAMASGCVVFAGDTLGNSGFIREGVTGFICNDRDELAQKLSLYDSEIGQNAREYVMKYHTDKVVAPEIVRVFKKIVDTVVVV